MTQIQIGEMVAMEDGCQMSTITCCQETEELKRKATILILEYIKTAPLVQMEHITD